MISAHKELQNIYRFRYVVYSFVQTNIRQRYRRSVLGFLWTIFAPLLQYLIIALVFKYAAGMNDPAYFPHFFTGAIVFNAFSTTLLRAPMIMLANEIYIKKIYLPKSIYVLSTCLYEMTNFFLTASTLFALGLVTGYVQFSLALIAIPVAFLLILVTMLGLSAALSVGGVYFRDLAYITPPIMQALFFLTPIVYLPSVLPQKAQDLLSLNPFYHLIELIRVPLTKGEFASAHHFWFSIIFAICSFFIGQWILRKFDNRIIFKL